VGHIFEKEHRKARLIMDIEKQKKVIGKVKAVSISDKKGMKKRNVDSAEFRKGFGIVGDAHAGTKNREVSLLSEYSIEKIRAKGLSIQPGDFAENITIDNIDPTNLEIGARLKIGETVLLEISQIGKECHSRCSIYHQVGDCVMPREGVFASVIQDGSIKPGDNVEVLNG